MEHIFTVIYCTIFGFKILSGNMFLLALSLSIMSTGLSVDLTYTVEEGKPASTYIGNIAVDSNVMDIVASKYQKLIRFRQLQHGVAEGSQLFKVSEKTGKLYTAETLDAEELCEYNKECFQMLDVAVQNGTSSIKILEVKIIIQDVNDHGPEFPHKQVNIEFDENVGIGMKKAIPNAVDRDIRVINSQISYELKKYEHEPFALIESENVDGTSKLDIISEKRLDREVKDSYLLKVIAKDGGSPPKQSVLFVHISVTDINDNIPIFSQKVYNISIENKQSETIPIFTMSAKDLDLGTNGKIYYHLTSKTSEMVKSHFSINKENGKIFLLKEFPLRHEIDHKLYVKATDGGRPPLSSIAMVLVNIINQQNNAPIIKVNFASPSVPVDILEDIKVGSFIAYVKITDNDPGHNGEVTCDLYHYKFQLRNLGIKKYEVTLKNPLDREKEDHHDVVISCQDKGSPPLHSNIKFTLKVMDVNDVRPQFTKDTFKFFIDENEKSRITVGYINATDPDLGAGGKLTYSLITNNKHFLPFKISPNGLLTAIMSLDHEFQDTYEFQVFVKDNGTPSLNNTVNVIVEVTDKNDNAPYFTFPSVNPYNMDVTYYPDRTKNITQMKALDSDSQENAFLKYEIIRGNDEQMFTMDQYTGLLGFNRQLSPENAGSYQLDIVVKDSGSPVLSATTTLFLTLTISNKTSQMLNVVELHTEEKVHLDLVIIITVMAVAIAVFLTASLSICIIRCNGQPNVAYAPALDPSKRYISEQLYSIAPSYDINSLPRPAHLSTTDQPLFSNTFLTFPRRQPNSQHKPQVSSDMTSQMYTQNVSIPPDYLEHWKYSESFQADGNHDLKRDTGNGQEKTDLLPSKTSSQTGYLSKSHISGPHPQSRNLGEMDNQGTSNARPLPPLPHTSTL